MANDTGAAKSAKKYKREVLLKDRRFAKFQKDFLAAILTEEEYTRIDEAVQEAFGDVTGDSGMSEGEIYETDTQDAAAAEVM